MFLSHPQRSQRLFPRWTPWDRPDVELDVNDTRPDGFAPVITFGPSSFRSIRTRPRLLQGTHGSGEKWDQICSQRSSENTPKIKERESREGCTEGGLEKGSCRVVHSNRSAVEKWAIPFLSGFHQEQVLPRPDPTSILVALPPYQWCLLVAQAQLRLYLFLWVHELRTTTPMLTASTAHPKLRWAAYKV